MRKRGVQVAVESLMELKTVTDQFSLDEIGVFATAPLRNIINTEEVLVEIEKETGFPVKVLSGQQEASYGFAGLRQQISMDEGRGCGHNPGPILTGGVRCIPMSNGSQQLNC